MAIALFAVSRVTTRLTLTEARSVYDIEEATEWVADRLPDELSGKLSHEDVQAILFWHLDYLRQEGLATYGRVDETAEEARHEIDEGDIGPVIEEDTAVDYVLAAADGSGRDVDAVDVVVVLDLEIGYLQAIGAIGDEVN